MKLFRFDPKIGKNVNGYDSKGFIVSRVVHPFSEAVINCAYLSPGGVIGYHQATVDQLFLVVDGVGWVRGETAERSSIHTGQAAYWTKGEWHESGTSDGMTAIIIECERLEPEKLMPAA